MLERKGKSLSHPRLIQHLGRTVSVRVLEGTRETDQKVTGLLRKLQKEPSTTAVELFTSFLGLRAAALC